MADFVSIAGLSIAVFDKIWIIGTTTAELISDYRHFDEDSVTLANNITYEILRTKTLRCLLFETSEAYNGNNLFDQLDEGAQIQIQIRLGKLLNIINESSDLLQGQKIEDHSSTFNHTKETSQLERKAGRALRLRWSLWDKRRLESVIKKFVKENEKVNAQVELLCHATSVGVPLKHLDRLKTNEHSKKLGFDLPAQLHLNAAEIEKPKGSLQIKDEELFCIVTKCSKNAEGLSVIETAKNRFLVEFRNYAPDKAGSVPLSGRIKERVELLAHLLGQRKQPAFHTLSCQGWMADAHENQVAFIFSLPERAEASPISLLSLYEMKTARPSLGDRLRLARSLTTSICEFQLTKWVHESFRSENIIFFPSSQKRDQKLKPEERLEISQPWVMGFEFSRPESDFSSGRADGDITRDVYRHPQRQKQPQRPFCKIHDIYSLGVVLLEIGLWRPVLSLTTDGFKRVNDPWTIQKYLVQKAERSLPREVGEHYKNVVIRCLTGSFDVENDNKEDLKLQQAFREHVLDFFDRAVGCIG